MLILSHEITEILCRNKQEQEDDDEAGSKKGSEQALATAENQSAEQLL
jgi:hypothetical protein